MIIINVRKCLTEFLNAPATHPSLPPLSYSLQFANFLQPPPWGGEWGHRQNSLVRTKLKGKWFNGHIWYDTPKDVLEWVTVKPSILFFQICCNVLLSWVGLTNEGFSTSPPFVPSLAFEEWDNPGSVNLLLLDLPFLPSGGRLDPFGLSPQKVISAVFWNRFHLVDLALFPILLLRPSLRYIQFHIHKGRPLQMRS